MFKCWCFSPSKASAHSNRPVSTYMNIMTWQVDFAFQTQQTRVCSRSRDQRIKAVARTSFFQIRASHACYIRGRVVPLTSTVWWASGLFIENQGGDTFLDRPATAHVKKISITSIFLTRARDIACSWRAKSHKARDQWATLLEMADAIKEEPLVRGPGYLFTSGKGRACLQCRFDQVGRVTESF